MGAIVFNDQSIYVWNLKKVMIFNPSFDIVQGYSFVHLLIQI